jgi:acetolactate synthase-1/2/3 large subunit
MHGTVAAVTALQKSDLLICLGARFDDRVTGKLDSFAPGATVIHADIDPAEIGKNRSADVPIVGDCRETIAELVLAVQELYRTGTRADITAWWRSLDDWRTTYPLGFEEPEDGSLAPQHVISRIGAIAGPRRSTSAASASTRCSPASTSPTSSPYTWLNSGGSARWGTPCPAAMGAKVGPPRQDRVRDRRRRLLPDDQPGAGHLRGRGHPRSRSPSSTTATLGMVRQWQTLFYDERYSNTNLHSVRIPDFVKLADAYGCVGLRCEKAEEVDATIERAMAIDDVPVVVDFAVHQDAMVWPMVPQAPATTDPGGAPMGHRGTESRGVRQ